MWRLVLVLCMGPVIHVSTESADVIDTVHVIFMNHLDVGYNGISPITGYINNVLNIYFHEYFPRAALLGDSLRAVGFIPGFIYTTHPWVVSLFLDCPPDFTLNGIKLQCPSPEEVAVFERAVRLGDITWHAGPMNMQPENMNELLFEMSLNISIDLDNRFGIDRRFRTLSQRDVPGMSQAVLPALVRRQIAAISVGVNPDTAPPAVPRGLFLWKYQQYSAIAMWHPGGYPLDPGTSALHPGGLSRDDCVTVNSLNQALCFAFRTDNSGPPENIDEIFQNYQILNEEFPLAAVKASTFENFVESILPNVDKLPVYTQEIGDTWLMGVASDPKKMAKYRAISSTLTTCILSGDCDAKDSRIVNATRFLIKLPEHTWGLPGVNDNVNWTNEAFEKVRTGGIFKNSSLAWTEQRRFAEMAVSALGDHPVVKDINENLVDLLPLEPQPENNNFTKVPNFKDDKFRCAGGIELSFGAQGELTYLYDPFNQVNWANETSSLAKFLYRTFDENSFAGVESDYNYRPENPFGTGIHKINVNQYANALSTFWDYQVVTLWQRLEDGCHFLVHLEPKLNVAHTYFGAPDRVWIRYFVRDSRQFPGPDVEISLSWFDKTATRLPEALFLDFHPVHNPDLKWRMRKMGQLIDPLNVGLNGSQHVHGIDDAIFYGNDNLSMGLQIGSRDVPLVCPYPRYSYPTPFPVPLKPLKQVDAMAFNFYNNIWDTNYILWYPYLEGDENFKSRFSITFLR